MLSFLTIIHYQNLSIRQINRILFKAKREFGFSLVVGRLRINIFTKLVLYFITCRQQYDMVYMILLVC